MMTLDSPQPQVTIDNLPDEVLEFILDLVPPYKDLHDCMLVCKRWKRCVLNVTKTKRRNLNKAIIDFDVAWKSITPEPMAPTITKRYSHSAVVHENSMYVFGGCTCSMTTFNDLWRLDLSKRQWVRPLTMGTYPSPKACSTMVCYKDLLVLFGGWTYPPSYPLHQSWHLFNELHIYDITANRWRCINTINTPPPIAGHSVSVHGEWMVVFGGLQRPSSVVHSMKSNDIWKLNLESFVWYKQETQDKVKPVARYGQSQTYLDEKNVLIIGGSGGPSFYYSDVWVLNMEGERWKWKQVEVRNPQEGPSNIWSNPACKVGDKLIVLNRTRQSTTPSFMYYSKGVWVSHRRGQDDEEVKSARIDLARRQVDRDENVNGKRGTLKNVRKDADGADDESEPHFSQSGSGSGSGSGDRVFQENPSPSTSRSMPLSKRERREKRLENLKRIQDVFKHKATRKIKRNVLGIYVLDLSHALDKEPYVTWLPVKNDGVFTEGPEETILYTLVEGKSELIMFGGIQKDASSLACTTNLSNQVSNSLHFITAPKYII